MISLPESYKNHIQSGFSTAGDCCFFNLLQRTVDGKHLMRFQRENAVLRFPRRSVDSRVRISFQCYPPTLSLCKSHQSCYFNYV